MKLLKLKGLLLLTLGVMLFTSCSEYNKILKSNDKELIYEEAMRLYENESYSRALQLFDRIAVHVKGTDKEAPLNYYYAQCYYLQYDYTLANYYFMKYAKQFPFSTQAEECYFLAALCKYKESSVYSLDPTPTNDAITQLQGFINYYPNSDKVEECNKYIDELRAKLEEKDYKIAMMYLRMEEYKAAVVCFNNILKDIPDTQHKEEILYNVVRAKYEYAKNSVSDKKAERYKEVIDAYYKFISLYPDSEYGRSVESYFKVAKQFV
jgi:outer membrane protein assembly factor BamD